MCINHLIYGTRAVRKNFPVVLIAFIFKLSLSLLLLIPLQGILSDVLSHRPAATSLLADWNLTPLIDLIFNNPDVLQCYGYVIIVGSIIIFTLHLFLSGGFYRTLTILSQEDSETFGIDRFFAWCGEYFHVFFKLTVLSIIFYFAAAILSIILSELGVHLFFGKSVSEPARIFILLVHTAILILLLLFVNMCMLYMKIIAVTSRSRSILSIVNEACLFLRKTIGKVIVLYAILLFGLLVITGTYCFAHFSIQRLPLWLSIIALFICQQVFSFARSWYRLIGYASHIHLYNAN